MSITSYEFVPSYVIIAILLLDNISKGGACYPTHSPSPKSAPTCCFQMITGRVARYVNYIIPICPKLCNCFGMSMLFWDEHRQSNKDVNYTNEFLLSYVIDYKNRFNAL